jgi:outer membrane scaffolding protein for murein synthesis (MipA/OmpV family)
MKSILASGPSLRGSALVLAFGLAGAAWAGDAALIDGKPDERWRFGGAIGATLSHGPAYAGADTTETKLRPALLLRWGPISLSSTSGLSPRRDTGGGEAIRGLGVSLLRSETIRMSLSLRYDSGRDGGGSSDTAEAAGSVPETLRTRLRASWRFAPEWRLAGSVSIDALGRGGGTLADFGVQRDGRFTPTTGWSASLLVSAADRRYQRAYYGVTPESAQRTGVAVYTPDAGWRDVALGFRTSTELGPHWTWINGANLSQLLGQAAASPLAPEDTGWALSSTLAWRF